jgi:hypothetical protein
MFKLNYALSHRDELGAQRSPSSAKPPSLPPVTSRPPSGQHRTASMASDDSADIADAGPSDEEVLEQLYEVMDAMFGYLEYDLEKVLAARRRHCERDGAVTPTRALPAVRPAGAARDGRGVRC